MISLLTNKQSISGQRYFNINNLALQKSQQRLASSLRINSARDDAAGLQISDRMTSQINGLNQGNRNASDAIAFCQTTEGALDEVTEMLQKMRTLALQSATGTNGTSERAALQEETSELIGEITRIGSDTTFGSDFAMLSSAKNGQTIKFQVGSNAGQTIDLELKSVLEMCKSGETNLADLDLSTEAGANSMITAVDAMIKNVDSYRSTLGAKQNRLESTIRNQTNVAENISDARSRIRDTDYATESANLTAAQVQQQAVTAMLSQANQSSSIVLSLLG